MQPNDDFETLGCTPIVAAQIEAKRAGRRDRVYHGKSLCSGCYAEPPMSGQRYGHKCHAAKQRELRARRAKAKAHSPSPSPCA